MVTTDPRLAAVNTLLSAIGEAPVNTVTGSGLVEVAQAVNSLDEATRRVLSARYWWFNTEFEQEHTPSPDNKEVILGTDYLTVIPSGYDRGAQVAVRGGRLFDSRKSTFEFERPITLTVQRLLPFEDLPSLAQTLVVLKATRIYVSRIQGRAEVDNTETVEEQRAWADLMKEDARQKRLSLYQSTPVAQVMSRRGPWR